MSEKDKCKKIMSNFFGPATEKMVDYMTEEDCFDRCRERVRVFMGEEKAEEFDKLFYKEKE